MKPATLQTIKPLGRTIWLVMVYFIFLLGVGEWVTRLEGFQTPLTPPKMGSRHYQLGHKLSLLEAEVKRNGPIDCLMIGSSMVDVGFDPAAFQESYKKVTGRDIRCFNFGIDASSSTSAAALTKILVEDYRPRLLIVGTDPRDYAVPSDDVDPSAILDSPWVKYRQGDFSLEGWLLDHSYLHRYRQHVSRLVRFQFEGTFWSDTRLTFPILPNGFTPLSKVSTYINDPPSPQDESYEVSYYTRIYSHYQMLEENFDALRRILDYDGSETQVVVVEMPVSDGLYYFFGNGNADYSRFVVQVNELTRLEEVLFWQTESLDLIPDDGWSDYSHLNVKGAEIFSTWLGEQVSGAERWGSLQVVKP